jgi:hypothetical protein
MLGALIIVFREVVEAGLVIGIVLAATRGIQRRGWWVSLGVLAGVFGASVVAAFAGAISDAFAGSGQELLNAGVLLIAVVSLTWHNVWMAEHGRELVAELRQVGSDVSAGLKPLTALAVVVFVAVMREGSEIVLFLYGIVVSGTSMASLLAGGVLGLLGGAAMTALSYFGLIAIPTRYIFQVTSVLAWRHRRFVSSRRPASSPPSRRSCGTHPGSYRIRVSPGACSTSSSVTRPNQTGSSFSPTSPRLRRSLSSCALLAARVSLGRFASLSLTSNLQRPGFAPTRFTHAGRGQSKERCQADG